MTPVQEKKETITIYLRQTITPWGEDRYSIQTAPYDEDEMCDDYTRSYRQFDLTEHGFLNTYLEILSRGVSEFGRALWS
jgi:hypothetical protein